MLIYEYPKCSTCKKAKKFISENEISAEFVDITKQTPTKEDFEKILKIFNVPIKKLFNTSGIKYKELQLKDKLPNYSNEEAIKLLTSDGMLIKRPIAFDFEKNFLLVGFKEEIWKETLLKL